MRIWHQSISELDSLPQYRKMLQEHADRVTGTDTVVDVHGMRPGTYPDGVAPIEVLGNAWCHYLANVQIVEAAVTAQAQGYDAVVITCFHDPALTEARSMVDIPVLSMCESTLLTACTLGESLGLVGIGPANVHLVRAAVRRYGLEQRVCGVLQVEDRAVDEHEIDSTFGTESPLTDAFRETARTLIASGADVLVPSESLLNTTLVQQGLTDVDGVPVVDSFAVMLAHAEMMVGLRRTTGLQVSRTGMYARPQAAAVDTVRAATRQTLST
jgi:allantoin racemase